MYNEPSHQIHTGQAAIENALNNRRNWIKSRKKQCFRLPLVARLLSPLGRQMAIENSISSGF